MGSMLLAPRLGRLGVNLLGGAAFIETCYRLPSISAIDKKHLNDYGPFRLWVNDLVSSLNIKLEIIGEPVSQGNLFVSNHVSWADTVILNHAEPLSFISRHDVEEWPFIGTFTQRMASVYVDRTNKFQAYRSIPSIVEKLKDGRSVLVFPESTTSTGDALLPFYGMFLESAVRAECYVQPVALKYTDKHGRTLREAAYAGEDSFGETLVRLLKQPKVYARLEFLEPIDARVHCRKKILQLSQTKIHQALYD
jgi:1-acyl-sn-glycerol-3-phosphate acyltransferase